MIPVSLRFPVCLLAAIIGSAGLSLAGDIIKLKSGEKLDGVIVSETPTEVTIEIQTGRGGSIKDPKKVLRKDIAELIKATPDQFEAAELGKLLPAPDMMTDAAYQKVITEKLEPFLKKYPATKYKGDVEAIVKAYQEEMAKAKAGSKKLEGVWVPPAELIWNAYNFEARLLRVEMTKLLQAGKPEAAYRLLSELEQSKPASVETVTAIELFKTAIPELERTLDRLTLEHPIKIKTRMESAATLSKDDRKRFDDALKQDEADLKLRIEEDKKAKLALQAYSEYDLKSIADAKVAVQKETARLNKLDVAGMKVAATTFQTGLKNFHEKSFLSAQRNFDDAGKFFAKDSFVKERAELAKKAAADAARINAEAAANKPSPVTTTGAAAKTDDKAKTAEPAKTAGGAPVKKTPSPAADNTTTEEPGPPEPAPSSNLSMLLIAGAAVLLILLVVVKMLAKKKTRADD